MSFFSCFHLAVLVDATRCDTISTLELLFGAFVTTWARLKATQVTLCHSNNLFPPLLCCSTLTTRALTYAHPLSEHLRHFPVLLQEVYWWEDWLQQLNPGFSRRSFVIINLSVLFNTAPSFHLSWQLSHRTPVKCGSGRRGSCWNLTGLHVSAFVPSSQWSHFSGSWSHT